MAGYTNPNQRPPAVAGKEWVWDKQMGAWRFTTSPSGTGFQGGALPGGPMPGSGSSFGKLPSASSSPFSASSPFSMTPQQGVGQDPSRWRQLGGFVKDNLRTITDVARIGEGVYDRWQQNKDRKRAEEEYKKLQPLRDAAMAGLLDTSRRETASIFEDPNSPQGQYRPVNVGSRGRY